METPEEFKELLQKFVDKTINEEELERFYAYVNDPSNGPQLKQLLHELWGYIELTKHANPDDVDREVDHQSQGGLQLIDELIEIKDEFSRRVNALIVNVIKGDYH